MPRALALSFCLVAAASAVASPARANPQRARAVRGPHRTCAYDEAFEIMPVAVRPPGSSARVAAIVAARARGFRDGLRDALRDACEEGIPADVRPLLAARCEVPFASAELVSVACEGYVVVGSAHGIKSSSTTNLDLASARALRLEDLFLPGTAWRGALDRLSAADFNRATGGDANDFIEQPIPAAAEFVVTRQGLRFYLENSVPFVAGSVHPFVAWSALRQYLRPNRLGLFLPAP
jgi:hypothetical protein